MRKIFTLSLLATALLSFTACDKEEDSATTVTVDAIMKWSGDYAVDGCGYSLMIGEEQYKPTNEADIPETYKEAGWEGMAVEVKVLNYNKKITVNCGVPAQVNAVKVLEIRKK